MGHVTEREVGDGTAPRGATSGRLGAALLMVGVVLLAFNLRPGVTSVPPLFGELGDRLGLPPIALTWLATAPVLCFAVFSAPAVSLSRRFGEEAALGGALAALAAGLALRGLAPRALLYPGTVLACAAIAVMNVLLTSLVKRRRPDRVGMLLGMYLLSLYVGAIIASAISVPLSQATGGPSLALGIWALPAVAALLVWLPQFRQPRPSRTADGQSRAGRRRTARRRDTGPSSASVSVSVSASVSARSADSSSVRIHRRVLAWQVAAFMGLQSLTYFTTLSWLPLLFQDRGTSAARAGFLVSMLGIGGIATALLAPMLAQRLRDQRALITPIVAATAAGIAGALYAPLGIEVALMALLGLGQGAALGVALYLTIARAANPAVAASLSAMTQGVGYLLASAGPLAIGLLRTATGGWTVPMLTLLVITVVEWVFGLLASRPLTIGEPHPDLAAAAPVTARRLSDST